MLAYLGRTSSTLVVILVALLCVSLSSVSAGPIPSLAPRGKRFQCSDETHSFTVDDSDNVTQCPQGTVCRATSHGSPCVFAGSDSVPAPLAPVTPGDTATLTSSVIESDKPVETATPTTPLVDAEDEETCEADNELTLSELPPDTTTAGEVPTAPEGEVTGTPVVAPTQETPAPTDSSLAREPAATSTESTATSTTMLPQVSVTPPTGQEAAAPGTEGAQQTPPSAEEETVSGEQAGPMVPEPQGQLADALGEKASAEEQPGAANSPPSETGAKEPPVTTTNPLSVDAAASSTDTTVPDATATPAPPAQTGPIGLSADGPTLPNLQVKQADETVAGPSAPTGGVNGGAHVNGRFTYHEAKYADLGSCGPLVPGSLDSEPYYVAISPALFTAGGDPNKDPVCGKKIRASYQGKSVILQAVDKCMGCDVNSLDLAPAAFEKLVGSKEKGEVTQGTSWDWV